MKILENRTSQMYRTIEDRQQMLWRGSHDTEANHLLRLREAFQKYIDCSKAYPLRLPKLSFCDGFSLGSRLTFEALMQVNRAQLLFG